MNKAAAATGVALLGTAASVGGVYLSRKNNFDLILPKDAKEFVDKGHKQGCVNGLFPALKSLNLSGTLTEDNWEASSVLGSDNKKDTRGCLVVNWNKKNFEHGNEVKWKGGFRFLWSVKNDKNNGGLIVFAVADPANNGKLKGTGSAYAINLGNDKEWQVIKKLAIADAGKEVEVKDKFPKAKSMKPQYWGYLEESTGTMDKLCGESDCKDDSKSKPDTYFQGYWIGSGGEDGKEGNESLGEWMANLSDWWKEVFGEEKVKIAEVVNGVKGKGTERAWYGIDKPQESSSSSSKPS